MKKRTAVITLSSILFLTGTAFGKGYSNTNFPTHIKNAQIQEQEDKRAFEEKKELRLPAGTQGHRPAY